MSGTFFFFERWKVKKGVKERKKEEEKEGERREMLLYSKKKMGINNDNQCFI